MKGQLFAYWPTVKQNLGRSFSELLEAGEEASEEEEKEGGGGGGGAKRTMKLNSNHSTLDKFWRGFRISLSTKVSAARSLAAPIL
jgi:hypothetical protein